MFQLCAKPYTGGLISVPLPRVPEGAITRAQKVLYTAVFPRVSSTIGPQPFRLNAVLWKSFWQKGEPSPLCLAGMAAVMACDAGDRISAKARTMVLPNTVVYDRGPGVVKGLPVATSNGPNP